MSLNNNQPMLFFPRSYENERGREVSTVVCNFGTKRTVRRGTYGATYGTAAVAFYGSRIPTRI